jgi:hypothetical protein
MDGKDTTKERKERTKKVPAGLREFCFVQNIQVGCGAHPPSNLMGTGCYFLGGKAALA